MFNWSIFEYELVTNPVFKVDQIIWSDTPTTILVENSVRSVPSNPPTRPDYYYVPAVWKEVIDTIAAHGIEYEVVTEEVTLEVVNYRMEDFERLSLREGLYTAGGTPIPERCTRTYRMNDIRVPTDQALGTLAVALLEPVGEQSFFYYGFFNSAFYQNEHTENYIIIPVAEMMLDTYPEIAEEWSSYVTANENYTDQDVADWFFTKTSFYDHDAYVYPVGMVYPNETQSSITAVCPEPVEISHQDLQAMLPPSPPWDDSKHSEFIVASDDPFVTPAEASGFNETATYGEVTDFFTRLASESEYVEVESLMKFANGEDLWLVKVSGEKAFTATNMTNPLFYATGGIHPGESCGVNAGMMLARNLVIDPAYSDLLNAVNFFFIPIFNVQGYLRQSSNSRMNQVGPNTSGRRGNGKNQNLNRDFSKLINPETRAVVSVFNNYDVSFYADLHADDGVNYVDDVTFCDNGDAGLSNSIHTWLRTEMEPDLFQVLMSYDHSPGNCYYVNDPMDPMAGSYPYFTDSTEYSTNYADHRQIPAYLMETHSLKPFKQRVLGAYIFLQGIMSVIANKTESLLTAIAEDQAARIGKCKSRDCQT
jgi:Zinc carboxypeptidase